MGFGCLVANVHRGRPCTVTAMGYRWSSLSDIMVDPDDWLVSPCDKQFREITFLLHVLRAGLSCRSGAYFLYALTSTVVWMLLVSSSILAHYATAIPRSTPRSTARIARAVSIALRQIGKTMGVCNATWLVVLCVFQCSTFFNSCYCNGSVLGRGAKAFVVFSLSPEDASGMTLPKIGGLVLSTGVVVIYAIFVAIFMNPRLPPKNDDQWIY